MSELDEYAIGHWMLRQSPIRGPDGAMLGRDRCCASPDPGELRRGDGCLFSGVMPFVAVTCRACDVQCVHPLHYVGWKLSGAREMLGDCTCYWCTGRMK